MSEPILIAEDDPMQQELLQTLLRIKLGFGAKLASNGRHALNILERDDGQYIRLAILDIKMPIMDGLEALEIIRQKYPKLPVIIITGSGDVDLAVRAMKLGATDFITKPYENERMVITIKNAMKLSLLSKELERLTKEKERTFGFDNLIGHDKGLLPVVMVAKKAASADIPVFISGETGVGKEILAQAIHGESIRAGKSFVTVNCGAIPAQLVESTLFGHEKGSFTGAVNSAIGKFREADGGTIFLDEVGDLPLDSQVKLLRVLQQREVEPVGSSKTVPVDVRVISATHHDLETEVKEGRFREDLYYRLHVLPVEIPPLRDRKQDIPILTHHFIERFCAKEGRRICSLTEEAITKLNEYDWPGNVRQLENTINRAMVMQEDGSLDVDVIVPGLEASQRAPEEHVSNNYPLVDPSAGNGFSLYDVRGRFKKMDDIEQEIMHLSLQHHDGNVTQAAKALGMAKSTFYRKMEK